MTLHELLAEVEGAKAESEYPLYGVAPHECYWRKPGGFERNKIGESTILDLSQWPENFLLEVDRGGEPQLSYGACGVYVQPGDPDAVKALESDTLWSKARVQAWLAAMEKTDE